MSDDDAKKIILARRARFVAAAVASVGIACGKTEAGPAPMPCLGDHPQRRRGAGERSRPATHAVPLAAAR